MDMSWGQLSLSEEQIEIREVASQFCAEKSPIEKVRALIDTEDGFDRTTWQELVELGWLSVAIPEQFGGIGLTVAEVAVICEQMGRHLFASPFIDTTVALQLLLKLGSDKQIETYLPALCQGKTASLALSETERGWDMANIECQASSDGASILLQGQKSLVFYGAQADILLISVKLDGELKLIIVEGEELGKDRIRREKIIDDTKRSYVIQLNDLKVPNNRILPGDAGVGLQFAHLLLNLLNTAEMVGGTQNCLDYTNDYLKTRKQFGRIIGSYQSLKHTMVQIYMDYEKAKSLLYSAAASFEQQGTGEIATRMAKVEAQKTFAFAGDRAIQFHGGFGFTYECDAQLYRRRAMLQNALFGDAAWHKKKLAALML